MPGKQGKPLSPNGYTRKRHVKRLELSEDIKGNPELEAAWHNLQLHWLSTVPGYREEIKQRVSKAAKRAESRSTRILNQYDKIDYLENFSCD